MDALIFFAGKLLGALVMPPFLFVLIGVVGLTQVFRHPWIAVGISGSAFLAILACSTPAVSSRLIQSIQAACPDIGTLSREADAIVILGGGVRSRAPEYGDQPNLNAAELERLRHGARLHRATGRPILVTGGSPEGAEPEALLMRDVLDEDFGVKSRWTEPDSRTTRENARNSARILKAEGLNHIYLVSQGWHLARAVRAFESEGFQVTPAGTGCKKVSEIRWLHFLPHPEALEMSYWAIHEWVGILWYDVIGRLEGRNPRGVFRQMSD